MSVPPGKMGRGGGHRAFPLSLQSLDLLVAETSSMCCGYRIVSCEKKKKKITFYLLGYCYTIATRVHEVRKVSILHIYQHEVVIRKLMITSWYQQWSTSGPLWRFQGRSQTFQNEGTAKRAQGGWPGPKLAALYIGPWSVIPFGIKRGGSFASDGKWGLKPRPLPRSPLATPLGDLDIILYS